MFGREQSARKRGKVPAWGSEVLEVGPAHLPQAVRPGCWEEGRAQSVAALLQWLGLPCGIQLCCSLPNIHAPVFWCFLGKLSFSTLRLGSSQD